MRWWIVILAACGSAPVTPPPPEVAPPPVVQRDPMAEASLMADLRWLADPARRGRSDADAIATAQWIAGELRAAGYAPELQRIGTTEHHNVIAAVGTGRAIVVMAHYDHLGVVGDAIHPGANDNASGVAVALAVARQLRATPPAQRVVFVFTGLEERGLRGARAYAAQPSVPLAELRAVINLDMVGRHLSGQERVLAAIGLPDDAELAAHATTAAEAAGVTLQPVPASMVTMLRQDHRSDDWVFRDAGIAAIHISSGFDDDYHRATDTIDKIVPAQLARCAKLVRSLVALPRS